MLHALLVLALVLGSVGPLLHSETVLLILEPLAFVPAAVEMRVDTIAIGFVLVPLALVDVSLRMHKSSIAVGHSVSPETIVAGSVWPNLNSAAIFLVLIHEPLALVHGSVFEDAYRLDFSLFSIRDILDGPVERLQLLNYILKTKL